jgi:hypothetical protein
MFSGNWTPIFSPDDTVRLRLVLNRRETGRRVAPARKYLMTGYIRCSRCGGRMSAHAAARGRRRYVCQQQPGYPNCGKMSVLAEPLEEVVAEMLFVAVDDDALRAALESQGERDDGLLEAIRRDELALEGLSKDHYVDGLISREEFLAARGELTKRLEANRLRLAQQTKANVLAPFASGTEVLRGAWEDGSLDWRRSVVGALLDQVEVLPGRPGRLPFDPARVRPVWKH